MGSTPRGISASRGAAVLGREHKRMEKAAKKSERLKEIADAQRELFA
jgi:hypothetical protein